MVLLTPQQKLQKKLEAFELSLLKAQCENPYKKSKIRFNNKRIATIKQQLFELNHPKPRLNTKQYLQKKYGLFAHKHEQK